MDNNRRPRHIRDIAHLYISQSAPKDQRPATRVFVTATTKECFGGYHAANIALGFSQTGCRVKLLELSNVLPGSAYFLRLPPKVYVKRRTNSLSCGVESFSALNGIRVYFDVPGDMVGDDVIETGIKAGQHGRQSRAVEVIHLPPVADHESLHDMLGTVVGSSGTQRQARALVLAPTEADAREAGRTVFGRWPSISWVTLSIRERTRPPIGRSNGGQHLGYLAGWRPLLADPLPSLVRDPESHVSRSYLSICDALMSLANTVESRHDGTTKNKRSSTFGRLR